MNLGTFFVDAVIVHDVPRRTAGSTVDQIVFSEVVSDIDQGLKNFFRERMIRSLSRQAYEVERDPGETSPVPGRVAAIVADGDALVDESQGIAKHLWACQTGVNPAGLLIVCTGAVEGQPALGILKLEREDAIRVEQTDQNGAKTFSIAHLRDLMLGKNTKVFKASLFVVRDGAADAIDGLVSDDQRGYDPHSEVAQFFLRRFLGCRLKTANDVATKAFFEISQEFINTKVDDDATKARYEVALLAQMNAPTATITPKTFADNHLDVDDRKPYRDFLAEQGAPTAAFDKDPRLVKNRITQMTLATQSGIRISGTSDAIQERVTVNPEGAEEPVIEVRDQLKKVQGGRG